MADAASTAGPDNEVVAYGMLMDEPIRCGKARCIAVYGPDGQPKILHCRMGSVWGTTTNSDEDFAAWCDRFDVRGLASLDRKDKQLK